MRHILFPLLALILSVSLAEAQSISDDLPAYGGEIAPEKAPPVPAVPMAQPGAPTAPSASLAPVEPFTVTDVNVDVTADSAAHARDQALTQAERQAFTQLAARMNSSANLTKIDDDTISGLVQSFEVQSEHLSSVRYIGIFTIRFKPISTQKKLGATASIAPPVVAEGDAPPVVVEAKQIPQGPLSHVLIGVQADSLATWMQIKRRINAVPQVANIETLDLARGLSHIDLSYAGSIVDLQQAMTTQGLILRQTPTGIWELYDGSMISR